MGFRTVVMLNNDLAHEWSKDPELGLKIHHDMSLFGYNRDRYDTRLGSLGRVTEVVHADVQTLVVLEHYSNWTPLSMMQWYPDQQNRDLELLKRAAEELGYRLVKRSTKK